ncbi:MAG: amidohydrolase [Anaerolineae bacterium]|nr:amidohydrolase [Anaerolineae bacterium]
MKNKADVIEWLEENRKIFTDMADAIWQRPELAFHEFFASALQADFLEEQGFRVTRDVAGINTAFIAEYGQGSPVIAFAGEYDALPALSQKAAPIKEALAPGAAGHGCGHNLLGTAHVAAVAALKGWMAENHINGTLRYYGCPAEEAGGAKTYMARDGLFDDLDAAFNFHPLYANTASKGSMIGVNTLRFRFHGRSAHAGAAPHLGRSALDAVELLNIGINYLREHVTPDVRMHYSITNGGGAPNVVPAEAEGVYMIRAHQPDNLREVTQRVRKIAQGAALMTETEVEEIFVAALSSMLNNHTLADLQYANMQEVGPIIWSDSELDFARQINQAYPPGTDAAIMADYGFTAEKLSAPLLGENYAPLDEGKIATGSTDVGDLSWKTPVSMLTTACWSLASVGHSWGVVATSGMSIGHKGMLHAAKVMALSAIDLYTQPETLRRARAEFEKQLKAHPYVNPIPAHIQPPRFEPGQE